MAAAASIEMDADDIAKCPKMLAICYAKLLCLGQIFSGILKFTEKVLARGLEPPWVTPYASETYASASSPREQE